MILEYIKPSSLEQALKLRAEKSDAVYMAGSTEVNSLAYDNVPMVGIDIMDLLPHGQEIVGEELVIGAGTTFQDLVDDMLTCGVLREAAGQMTPRPIRQMATIGGNICTRHSSANLLNALMVLDATVELLTEQGTSLMPIEQFLAYDNPVAIVTKVRIPRERANARHATRRYSRCANDISIVLVNVSFTGCLHHLHDVRIAIGGVDERPVRLLHLEKALEDNHLPERSELEDMIRPLLTNTVSDLRASAEYKREVAAVMAAWAMHNTVPGCEVQKPQAIKTPY